jgi:MbtH protein
MTDTDAPGGLQVLVNDAGAYGLHPAHQPVPDGWRRTGFVGDEAACMRYVDEQSGLATGGRDRWP